MSARCALGLLLLGLIGFTGCRGPRGTADTRAACKPTAARSTGPLNRNAAEKEALAAVSAEVDTGSTCSVAGVKEMPRVYEVCVRIDPPRTGTRQLPEHWTVEIPKNGITQSPNGGGG